MNPRHRLLLWLCQGFSDGGDCALLDIEVKRHGGKTRKMPLYTAPPKREPPCKTGSQCTTKCTECAEPTPVAWANRVIGGRKWLSIHASKGASDKWLEYRIKEQAQGEKYEQVALYTSPPKHEPEPVIDKSAAIRIATSLGWTPKREWQGLTDDEIYEMDDLTDEPSWEQILRFVRAVEAKLKEKNT